MPKEKSAGAVIFRKNPPSHKAMEGQGQGMIYYLLLQYQSKNIRIGDFKSQKKHWDFPKGHIEQGETEQETVKREIEEETGLKDIKIFLDFKKNIKYYFRAENKTIFKTVAFYLAETNTEEIKISSEHIDYKWLNYKEALNQLTYKNAKEILKEANEFLTLLLRSG